MKTLVVFLVVCAWSFLSIGASELQTCPEMSHAEGVSLCLTPDKHPSSCLENAREACKEHGFRLCGLKDLAAAFESGVRNTVWSLLDVPNRDARINSCQVGNTRRYDGDECFVKEGPYSTWYIPNTPRPWDNAHVFCCRNAPVSFIYNGVKITLEDA